MDPISQLFTLILYHRRWGWGDFPHPCSTAETLVEVKCFSQGHRAGMAEFPGLSPPTKLQRTWDRIFSPVKINQPVRVGRLIIFMASPFFTPPCDHMLCSVTLQCSALGKTVLQSLALDSALGFAVADGLLANSVQPGASQSACTFPLLPVSSNTVTRTCRPSC